MSRVPNYRRATGEPVRPPFMLRRWMAMGIFGLGIAGALMVIAGSYAPAVLQTLAGALIFPLCVLIPAAMAGWAFTSVLMPSPVLHPLDHSRAAPAEEPPEWTTAFRFVLSVALGAGFLSLGTLLLGALSLLHHGIPLVVPIAAAAIGFFPTLQSLRQFDRGWFLQRVSPRPLLLAACVPLGLLLVAVTFPVGTLWLGEGKGYDVMTYHLQLPREYVANGTTAPLGHNVYSFFPSNMEMLYTLLVSLTQGTFATESVLLAIYPAQLLHACITVLAAIAVASAPIRCSTLARLIAFTVVIGTPWSLVVGSLAYNDNMVLLYGALAVGVALGGRSWRNAVVVGILVGLAVGCKMTAGVMIAAPVAALFLLQRRVLQVVVVAGLAALLYVPWGVRAMVATHGPGQWGNPVFPIAANTLGRGTWSQEQVDRWNRGHSPQGPKVIKPDGTVEQHPITLAGRLHSLVHETLLDSQWSPGLSRMARWTQGPSRAEPPAPIWAGIGLLWLIVPVVLVLGLWHRLGWQLLIVLAMQVLAWLFFTHLQARFLLPAIIPMAILFGLAADAFPVPRVIILGFVALNAALCAFLLIPDVRLFAGGPEELPIGTFNYYPAQWSLDLNGGRTYLIGPPFGTPLYMQCSCDYNTVWDRNELADHLHEGGDSASRWLRESNLAFVLVDWPEVERLRNSYGFDPAITRESINALVGHGLIRANAKYHIDLPGDPLELFEVEHPGTTLPPPIIEINPAGKH
jgi:hypothetical protein